MSEKEKELTERIERAELLFSNKIGEIANKYAKDHKKVEALEAYNDHTFAARLTEQDDFIQALKKEIAELKNDSISILNLQQDVGILKIEIADNLQAFEDHNHFVKFESIRKEIAELNKRHTHHTDLIVKTIKNKNVIKGELVKLLNLIIKRSTDWTYNIPEFNKDIEELLSQLTPEKVIQDYPGDWCKNFDSTCIKKRPCGICLGKEAKPQGLTADRLKKIIDLFYDDACKDMYDGIYDYIEPYLKTPQEKEAKGSERLKITINDCLNLNKPKLPNPEPIIGMVNKKRRAIQNLPAPNIRADIIDAKGFSDLKEPNPEPKREPASRVLCKYLDENNECNNEDVDTLECRLRMTPSQLCPEYEVPDPSEPIWNEFDDLVEEILEDMTLNRSQQARSIEAIYVKRSEVVAQLQEHEPAFDDSEIPQAFGTHLWNDINKIIQKYSGKGKEAE